MLTTFYIHRFITSLIFTDAVEASTLFLLLRYVFKTRTIESKKILFAGLFASFATIPYVWFVFPYVADWQYNTALLWSEAFAFVVEAVFYRAYLRTDVKTSFAVSLICNSASFFLARLLRAHGLWVYW